jgi:hypothetical protein
VKLRRLFYLLIALAVLFAPAGMPGYDAAMAMDHDMADAAAMDHCAKKSVPDPDLSPESCCILVCFGLPADAGGMERMGAPGHAYPPGIAAQFTGATAETATPPPRGS